MGRVQVDGAHLLLTGGAQGRDVEKHSLAKISTGMTCARALHAGGRGGQPVAL